jgi:L-ascorbate metabolism protein UlaG (beta-lactamase superfamily)
VAYVPALDAPALATPAQGTAGDTTIRFIGHSTFLITSPGGVTIATDYNGSFQPSVLPRVVTMNRAHQTHWTPFPDPAIEHVLRGWTDEGVPAVHNVQVDDVLIRNVTTDIRGGSVGRVPDGNSIFIFETGNLCIGHLGHLHHVLEGADLGWIGQLDIVMVPVDGGYTMSQSAMVETLQVLKARLVLPMHYFGQSTLARFLSALDESFDVETNSGPEITVSPATFAQDDDGAGAAGLLSSW